MATVTPDNLTVKFNLKDSVIIDIAAYNEQFLQATMYNVMLSNSVENFKVVDREPTSWNPATCKVEGRFEIPAGIFHAVIDSIVEQLISNDDWMESIAKGDATWLDLIEGSITAYKPASKYRYYLPDNAQFAERYFSILDSNSDEEGGDSRD